MTDILNKFSNLKKFSETFRHEIRNFFVFDEYTGHNYIYLTTDDQCYAFGINLYGCLAFGHNISVEEPQHVPELSQKSFVDFFKGHNFMFGRTSDNEIYCWGQNESGQLGLGFRSFEQDFIKPERNEYLSGRNISHISCGYKHVIALTSNGQVYGWGENVHGQVGCGLDDPIISKPANLSSISSDLVIKSITAGDYHSMAVTVDNFLFAWGDNSYGQLATGDYRPSNLPKLVQNININISKTICSKSSTYFLTKEGKIYYCGENYVGGQEGRPNKLIAISPEADTPFVDITSGSPNYYCLAKTEESVYELMKNEFTLIESKYKNFDQYFIQNFHITNRTMSFNENNITDEYNGLRIEDCLIDHMNLFPHHLKNIIEFFCVFDDMDGKNCIYVTKDSKVYGFGSNYMGVLGIGTTGAQEEPALIKEVTHQKINRFYPGNGFMFAQNKEGDIFCWGSNDQGQLGLGYECDYCKPDKNDFLSGLDIIDMSCGLTHILALTRNGDVYGWGGNEWGQVGCGSNAKIVAVPTRVDIFMKIKAIACGDYHSLALTNGRSVYSWGKNEFGQLGQFWYDKTNAPSFIVSNNIISIACNHDNSYLLSRDGTLSVHGQTVCAFSTSTCQLFTKLPGASPDACLCASNGSVVAHFDGSVYELRRHEIPLIKQDYFSYNHFMVDNYSVTHRPVHIVNYDKLCRLGNGSFGTVFKCKDKSNGELFALKVLNNQGLKIEQTGKIFNELKRMQKLKSECLVNLESTWIENQKIICVKMHHYEHTLLDLVVAKPHAFDRKFFQQMCSVEFYITLEIYRQIVRGIDYLHSLKPPIIHRNIKSTNIFVNMTGKEAKSFIKISDFYFSKFNDWDMSTENELKIQSKYSMIDVINGKKFGFKTDVFNLATIGEELFEIGLFLLHSEEKGNFNAKISKVDKLFKSMQMNPHWWLRPTCKEVLASIEKIYPSSVELLTCSEFKTVFDQLKNYKITLFYEIVKSMLNQKPKE